MIYTQTSQGVGVESTHHPVYILPAKHNLAEWIFLTPCFDETLFYYFGFWVLHIKLQIKGISFTLIMWMCPSFHTQFFKYKQKSCHFARFTFNFACFYQKFLGPILPILPTNQESKTQISPHKRLQTTLINKYCKPRYVAIRK